MYSLRLREGVCTVEAPKYSLGHVHDRIYFERAVDREIVEI